MSLNLAWVRFSLVLLVWGVSPGLQGAIAETTEEVAPTTVLAQAEPGDRPAAPPVQTLTASEVEELLKQGKLQYRRAEFKQAIATYQQILAQPGASTAAKIEALSHLGDIDFWIGQIPQAETKFQQALKLARESGDRQAEGRVLALVAAVQRHRQEYAKALETLKTALEINQRVSDREGEARSRFFMGTVLYLQTQYPQALETFQQALKIDQTIGNQDEVVHIYNWMAITFILLKDLKQAEITIQQQQKLSREISYRVAEYAGLATIASLQQEQKQADQVLQTYQKQLSIAQSADNPWFQRATLLAISGFYVNQKQMPKALEAYQQALTVAKTIDDASVADVQTRLGTVYYQAAQYPESLAAYQQALATNLKIQDNQAGIAQAWLNIGSIHWQLEQYPKSIEAFQQALTIYQQLKNDSGIADMHNRIGNAFYRMEKLDKASEAYQRSVVVYQKTTNQTATAQVWLNLGNAYRWSKQYPQSISAFQQALVIYQKLNQPLETAQVWSNLGGTYYYTKQYPKSLEAYQQALMVYQKLGDRAKTMDMLKEIAVTYRQFKQPDNAIKTYHQALEFYQKTQTAPPSQTDLAMIGELHNRIGVIYSGDLENYPQAIAAYQQALVNYQKVRDPSADVAQVWVNLGSAYVGAKQYINAFKAYQQAEEIARKVPDRATELKAVSGRGITYVSQGQSLSHAAAYKDAIAVLEKAINSLQQARSLASELKNTNSEQTAIQQILIAHRAKGFVLSNQQQYSAAIAAFQQGLTVWRQYRDRLSEEEFLKEEQSTLQSLGTFYSNDGQHTKALAIYQESLQIAEQRSDIEEQVQLLSFITSEYQTLGENAKALLTSKRALTLVQEKLQRNSEAEMRILNKIGLILADLGQYDAAIGHHQQSLTIARTLKHVLAENAALGNIGSVYSSRGQYLQALDFQQQSFTLIQLSIQQLQSGDKLAVKQLCGDSSASLGTYGQQSCLARSQVVASSILNGLAIAYASLGRYKDALNSYEQALKIVQQYKDLGRQATFSNNIGNVYLNTGNYVKALVAFQKSLEIAVTTGVRALQATSLNNIGRVYNDQGQTEKALNYYQQSLALARAIQAPDREATALNNLGGLYQTQGDYDRALDFYQQSLAISRKHGLNFSTELNNIADAYLDQGRYPQALEQWQQALDIARQTGDRPLEVTVLRNIGVAYLLQANYARALEFYQQAQKLSQKMGSRSSELLDLLGQGRVYVDLGQYPQALALLQQALTLSRELGQKDREAFALGNIAGAYRKQENYPQALQFYQQSLTLFREIGDVSTESVILKRIAQTYEKQGSPDKAAALLQQALTIQRQIGLRPEEGSTLSTLGRVYLAQGKTAEAQETLQQALIIAQSINDRTTQAETLADLGKLFQTQPELAIVFYKQSVSVFETIRQGIRQLDRTQQESYTQTIADTYRTLADLLLKQNRILEAQQILDLLKVQELNDYLTNVRGAGKPVTILPPETEILKKYGELQKSAIELGKEFNQLEDLARTGTLTPAQRDRKNQLLKLQQELNQQFNQFTQRSDVVALTNQLTPQAIKQGVSLDQLDGLRDELRRLNAVMIYPLILDDRLELIITTPDSPPLRRTTTVKREDLNRAIAEFRQALQDPTQDAKPIAQKLYTWIIQPLEADLKQANAKTIIYAPDAQLRYIPLAALHDGQQWLVQRFRINNITAQSLTKFTRVPSSGLRVLAGASAAAREVTIGNTRQFFRALPFAAQEVNNVARLLPNTTKLINQDFSLDGFTSQMNAFTIVHLATHASFVPQDPTQSFILFGDGKTANLQDIGNWTLKDVDLVVLSACETAVGIQALGTKALGRGEEILGLGYQFQIRGAKATIASLWSVDDGGTQALISAFYQQLQSGKLTKAEALQQAQIVLLNTKTRAAPIPSDRLALHPKKPNQPNRKDQLAPGYTHPYYWAPFILIGNGL